MASYFWRCCFIPTRMSGGQSRSTWWAKWRIHRSAIDRRSKMSNAVLKKNFGRMTTTVETNAGASQCNVLCCDIRMEECAEGCKIFCTTDDKAVCVKLQQLCRELDCCVCSVCCAREDECCCDCRFDCCECTCEMLKNGVCLCCSCKDLGCLEIVQSMCRCLSCCQSCGCECKVRLGDTIVCRCCC